MRHTVSTGRPAVERYIIARGEPTLDSIPRNRPPRQHPAGDLGNPWGNISHEMMLTIVEMPCHVPTAVPERP